MALSASSSLDFSDSGDEGGEGSVEGFLVGSTENPNFKSSAVKRNSFVLEDYSLDI